MWRNFYIIIVQLDDTDEETDDGIFNNSSSEDTHRGTGWNVRIRSMTKINSTYHQEWSVRCRLVLYIEKHKLQYSLLHVHMCYVDLVTYLIN